MPHSHYRLQGTASPSQKYRIPPRPTPQSNGSVRNEKTDMDSCSSVYRAAITQRRYSVFTFWLPSTFWKYQDWQVLWLETTNIESFWLQNTESDISPGWNIFKNQDNLCPDQNEEARHQQCNILQKPKKHFFNNYQTLSIPMTSNVLSSSRTSFCEFRSQQCH